MKAVVRNRADLEKWVNRCCEHMQQDKPYTVTIRPFIRPRTNPQNALMHVLFRKLGKEIGYTEEEIKAYFRETFGTTFEVKLPKGTARISKSTSMYNVEEASMMIEHIYRIAAENNINLSVDNDDE